jgi:hypothetical protein
LQINEYIDGGSRRRLGVEQKADSVRGANVDLPTSPLAPGGEPEEERIVLPGLWRALAPRGVNGKGK